LPLEQIKLQLPVKSEGSEPRPFYRILWPHRWYG
jgi:hypothetical protein